MVSHKVGIFQEDVFHILALAKLTEYIVSESPSWEKNDPVVLPPASSQFSNKETTPQVNAIARPT